LRRRLRRPGNFQRALSEASEASARSLSPQARAEAPEEPESDPEAEDPALWQWHAARQCADPAEGTVLQVRVEVRNRLMDRSKRAEARFMWLREDALMVSAAVDPEVYSQHNGHAASGMVFEYGQHTRHGWHYGGLVERPSFRGETSPQAAGEAAGDHYRPLLNEPGGSLAATAEIKMPEKVGLLGIQDAPWEVIALQDILYCDPARECPRMFTLHVHQHDSDLGHFITLELLAENPEVHDGWVDALCRALKEQRRHSAEAPAKTFHSRLMEWVEWCQFPVKFAAEVTIPDMDDPKEQRRYPLAFVASMAWLAAFAYLVVNACDGIHEDFGISTGVLGFTVAAAGTSFPNVFSGIVVSRQGRTTMAIANALGANVQNVFIALAIPWTVRSCFILHGPFDVRVENLTPAIVECGITLLPVVLVFLLCGATMPKWSGGLYLLTYVVYLVFALGQEITGCAVWPLPCSAAA